MSGGRKWKPSLDGAMRSKDGEIGGSHIGAVEDSSSGMRRENAGWVIPDVSKKSNAFYLPQSSSPRTGVPDPCR